MKLQSWTNIENHYNDYLLLGNGASIAIDNRLSYRSLYEQVCLSGKLNNELLHMFEYFETTNFEFIMKLLLEASQVNEVLNIEEDKSKEYYYELRDALISTIGDIHPKHNKVAHHLNPIAKFLSRFHTVLSLNYDLLVYWSMLSGNDNYNCQWFKDCFINDIFEKDFSYLYEPHQSAKGSTLVFYPHGSLFLATTFNGDETKLSRSSESYLLDDILSKWQEKDYIPLFVSEGTTKEKFRAITRSGYLNTVYDSVLSDIEGSCVIYGWSLNEQDDHIFDALDRKGVTRIAISVHTENPNWEDNCEIIERKFRRSHNLKDLTINFFDSKCKGCWIY